MSSKTIKRAHPAMRDDIADLTTRRPVPGQEVEQIDIDSDLVARMEVAQKNRKLIHDPWNRPVIVPIDAAEGFLRMRVQKIEAVRTRRR